MPTFEDSARAWRDLPSHARRLVIRALDLKENALLERLRGSSVGVEKGASIPDAQVAAENYLVVIRAARDLLEA